MSVSGSSRMTSHLNPRENLTSCTQYCEADYEGDHNRTKNRFAIFIMDEFIIGLAQTRNGNAGDINSNNRSAGQKAPQQITRHPAVLCPLSDTNPAKQRHRHIAERTAG